MGTQASRINYVYYLLTLLTYISAWNGNSISAYVAPGVGYDAALGFQRKFKKKKWRKEPGGEGHCGIATNKDVKHRIYSFAQKIAPCTKGSKDTLGKSPDYQIWLNIMIEGG